MQQKSKTFKVTRAGRKYLTFLEAFNSGSPKIMLAYLERHLDPFTFTEEELDRFMQWYAKTYSRTGGFRIHRNYLSEEYYVILIVQAIKTGNSYLHKLKITEEDPFLITEFNAHTREDE
jgi:hypothetical protein